MSNHEVMFERGPTASLSHAILLYQTARSGSYGQSTNAFATIHDIAGADDGSPVIGPGMPLSHAHLRYWTKMLGQRVAPQLLPEDVLVAHPDMLAWWVRPAVRTGHFNIAGPRANLKVLKDRTSVPVPVPAHVLIATRKSLEVYAIAGDQRPTADTVLLHSPILNVFSNGTLCWGNIAKPQTLGVHEIPHFERAVFDSWSTHPNPGQNATLTGKTGLVELWDDLAASKAKRFPVKRMKPFGTAPFGTGSGTRKPSTPITLGQAVSGAAT